MCKIPFNYPSNDEKENHFCVKDDKNDNFQCKTQDSLSNCVMGNLMILSEFMIYDFKHLYKN